MKRYSFPKTVPIALLFGLMAPTGQIFSQDSLRTRAARYARSAGQRLGTFSEASKKATISRAKKEKEHVMIGAKAALKKLKGKSLTKTEQSHWRSFRNRTIGLLALLAILGGTAWAVRKRRPDGDGEPPPAPVGVPSAVSAEGPPAPPPVAPEEEAGDKPAAPPGAALPPAPLESEEELRASLIGTARKALPPTPIWEEERVRASAVEAARIAPPPGMMREEEEKEGVGEPPSPLRAPDGSPPPQRRRPAAVAGPPAGRAPEELAAALAGLRKAVGPEEEEVVGSEEVTASLREEELQTARKAAQEAAWGAMTPAQKIGALNVSLRKITMEKSNLDAQMRALPIVFPRKKDMRARLAAIAVEQKRLKSQITALGGEAAERKARMQAAAEQQRRLQARAAAEQKEEAVTASEIEAWE